MPSIRPYIHLCKIAEIVANRFSDSGIVVYSMIFPETCKKALHVHSNRLLKVRRVLEHAAPVR